MPIKTVSRLWAEHRKLKLFFLSFLVGAVAAFTGKLTWELIAFLISLPTAYGYLNVKQKMTLPGGVTFHGEDEGGSQ